MGLFSSLFSSYAQPEQAQNPYLDYEKLLRANPNWPILEAAAAEAPVIPADFAYPESPEDIAKQTVAVPDDSENDDWYGPIKNKLKPAPKKRRSSKLVRETVDAEAPLVTRWKNIDRLFEQAKMRKPRR